MSLSRMSLLSVNLMLGLPSCLTGPMDLGVSGESGMSPVAGSDWMLARSNGSHFASGLRSVRRGTYMTPLVSS